MKPTKTRGGIQYFLFKTYYSIITCLGWWQGKSFVAWETKERARTSFCNLGCGCNNNNIATIVTWLECSWVNTFIKPTCPCLWCCLICQPVPVSVYLSLCVPGDGEAVTPPQGTPLRVWTKPGLESTPPNNDFLVSRKQTFISTSSTISPTPILPANQAANK